jgi:hypothetical protein
LLGYEQKNESKNIHAQEFRWEVQWLGWPSLIFTIKVVMVMPTSPSNIMATQQKDCKYSFIISQTILSLTKFIKNINIYNAKQISLDS